MMAGDTVLIYLLALAAVPIVCGANIKYTYKIDYLATPLDHFSFTNNETFQLRYLVNDTYWKSGGPIFFYTGNEGDIELFAQNTGFMWEIAPKFEAMLIFAEHRYYGKTMPYADKSYSDLKHLGYLTSTQALSDFVYLLDHIQTRNLKGQKKRSPVISFGGSYGGMLSAWMRLKYPYVVDGAVASSAPIYQFQGLTSCSTFTNIVAKVYAVSSKTTKGMCAVNIKKSWGAIRNVTASPEGRVWLTNELKLCKPLNETKDVDILLTHLSDMYGNIAMINYPYPTNFLAPVPAYPVRALCENLEDSSLSGKELITQLGKAVSIYTNYTGATKCLDFKESALGEDGWDFQACTEIVMPMCVDENNEMFEAARWDLKAFSDACYQQFGIHVPPVDLAVMEYGGKEADYSNIIFTNGLMDPWSPGGYLKSKSQSVYTILMPEAAHHLDLRASNPSDPVSVVNARLNITNIIRIWLKLFTYNF